MINMNMLEIMQYFMTALMVSLVIFSHVSLYVGSEEL